jgi:hypothetical protein
MLPKARGLIREEVSIMNRNQLKFYRYLRSLGYRPVVAAELTFYWV